MKKLQDELNRLEQENLVLKQEKRALEVKVSEMLELSGVEDPDRQWKGVTTCVETVATLPYLNASTLLGRSGELRRLAEKLEAKPASTTVGLEVPEHLRPSNFNRTKALRIETAQRWQELAEEAAAKAEAGLFNEELWWRWVKDSNSLADLEHKVSRLEKAWEHFAQVSTRVEEASKWLASLTDKPFPVEFEERLEKQLSSVFDSVAADRFREDNFDDFVECDAELALELGLSGWESNYLFAKLAVKGDECELRRLLTDTGLHKTEKVTELALT